MSLKELAGNANGDVGGRIGGSIPSLHLSPRGTVVRFAAPYFLWMPGKDFLAKRVVNGV